MPGLPLNCASQNGCDSTATFGPPNWSSASVNHRPICGFTPKTSPSDAVVLAPITFSGSRRPVITNACNVEPPIADKTWFRVFQSMYFGYDAGHVLHAGCVSYTSTNSSGSGYGSGARRTPLKMLN